MGKNKSLIRKYFIVSFIAFTILAVLMSLSVYLIIKNHITSFIGNTTAEYVQGLLHNQLKMDDISHENDSHLTKLLQEGALKDKLKTITMWDSDGNLLFSNKPSYTDSILSKEHELGLKGIISTSIVRSNNIWVLEVIAPTKNYNEEITGVHYLLWDINNLYRAATRIYISVSTIFLLGFIVLFISLYHFFKTANQKIEKQKSSLNELSNRLDVAINSQRSTYKGTIQALLTALDAKDNYTAGHSLRVANWSLAIGKGLGLNDKQLKLLEEAALFHDIGKIGVPEHVLNKPGKLDYREMEEVKKHPEIGAQIIGVIGSLNECANIIKHHHERYDGLGYPNSIGGKEIPIEARIIAVADTYDAITTNRPYQRAKSTDEAINILQQASGNQLDPDIVQVFINSLVTLKIA